MNKSIFTSKTFWLQVLAVASVMLPAVQAWLAANPVEFVAVLAALNVLVRFVTSGKVSWFSDGGVNGLSLAVCIGAAVALGTALPSCSAEQWAAARAVPVKACYITNEGKVCYSNVDGLSAEIDATGGK